MTVYRRVRPEEMRACISLADEVFQHEDFRTLIPKAYSPEHEQRAAHFAAFEGNQPVALVAALENNLHVGDAILKYGYIGTVCVHPAARKAGHMRKLLPMALDSLRESGCSLAMLNGARQRYGYFGFAPAGASVSYGISEANRKHALAVSPERRICFAPLRQEQASEAWQLHARQPMRADRPVQDFLEILQTYRRVAFSVSVNGNFAGYLACNASLDTIDELILADNALLQETLAAWMDAHAPKGFHLTVPSWDFAKHQQLALLAESSSISSPQQMAIFDFPRVVSAFLTFKKQLLPLPEGTLSLSTGDQGFTASIQGGNVLVSATVAPDASRFSIPNAVTALFSPFAQSLLPHAPAGWLPLPFALPVADEF